MAKGEHMTSDPHRSPGTLRPHRMATFAAALALLAGVVLWSTPSGAAGTGEWLSMVNDLRTSRGLAPLQLDAELSSLAQRWSEKMAADGAISHDPNLASGVSANWSKLGENVGTGSDRQAIMQAFINSPPHLANLLDPQFTRIGIGSTFVGDREYVVHRFMALADSGSNGAGAGQGALAEPTGPSRTDVAGSGFGAGAPRSSTPPMSAVAPASPDPEPQAPLPVTPPPAEPGRVAAVLSALRDATG